MSIELIILGAVSKKPDASAVLGAIFFVVFVILIVVIASRKSPDNDTTTKYNRPKLDPPIQSRSSHLYNLLTVQVIEPKSISNTLRAPLRWKGPHDQILVSNYIICNPLTYYSDGPPDIDEASCINLSLPVGNPVSEEKGALGYWPLYSGLTPNQRSNYLGWLANGKCDVLNDIGYAFIYFYGLERRVLVDNIDSDVVINEVVRLLNIYTFSRSFDSYLCSFVAFVIAKYGFDSLDEDRFTNIFESLRVLDNEECLAVSLAYLYIKKRPLPVSWALRIAKRDPRTPRCNFVDSIQDKFEVLFRRKYEIVFSNGLFLCAADQDRVIEYMTASPSLMHLRDSAAYAVSAWHTEHSMLKVPIPNVLGLQGQFAALVKIYCECVNELRPYARKLSKYSDNAPPRIIYESLPESIRVDTEHPDLPLWEDVIDECMQETGAVLVPTSRLAIIQGFEPKPKLTIKQSESIAISAQYMGIALEPDPRITNRPYGWGDYVSLYKPKGMVTLPQDSRYLGAALLLEMGISIAAQDGVIESDEINYIERFIEGHVDLNAVDAQRLNALKHLFTKTPPSLARIGKRIQERFTIKQRESLGRYLVGIAGTNGAIDERELSALKTAYKAMTIDLTKLDSLIKSIQTRPDEPVVVKTARLSHLGEPIPLRINPSETAVSINDNLVHKILMETNEVALMLGKVMRVEDSTVEEITDAQNTVNSLKGQYEGLESRYQPLLSELLLKDSWTSSEFDAIVRRHNLMPSGAIAVINEWAEQRYNDVLLEEGDVIKVHKSILVAA